MAADGSVKPSHAATPPSSPSARNADGNANLAAGRAGQELAQRDEVGVRAFVEPLARRDVLLPKVAQMRDRPPERGQAQPERDEQYFEGFGEHSSRGGCRKIVRYPC